MGTKDDRDSWSYKAAEGFGLLVGFLLAIAFIFLFFEEKTPLTSPIVFNLLIIKSVGW